MPLFLRPQTDLDRDGRFFYVHDAGGKVVGRIYRCDEPSTRRQENWFWGLSFHPGLGDVPSYGHEPTKELAMASFKARWLLSHPE